jgi:hypothetical protein
MDLQILKILQCVKGDLNNKVAGSLLKLIKELVEFFKELNDLTLLRLQMVMEDKGNI